MESESNIVEVLTPWDGLNDQFRNHIIYVFSKATIDDFDYTERVFELARPIVTVIAIDGVPKQWRIDKENSLLLQKLVNQYLAK